MGNKPLLLSRNLRTPVWLLLGLTAVLTALVAIFNPAFGISPTAVAVMGLSAVALPLALRPVDAGRWSRGRLGTAERVAALVAVALGAFTAVWQTIEGAAAVRDRDALGLDPALVALSFATAAIACAGVTLLLASLPVPFRRRHGSSAVAAMVGATVVCTAATGVVQAHDRCGAFTPDRDRWGAGVRVGGNDDSELIAEAIVRCGTLDGMSRAEVAELLGPLPARQANAPAGMVSWRVGVAQAAFGDDRQELKVVFGDDDRVDSAGLTYDVYAD